MALVIAFMLSNLDFCLTPPVMWTRVKYLCFLSNITVCRYKSQHCEIKVFVTFAVGELFYPTLGLGKDIKTADMSHFRIEISVIFGDASHIFRNPPLVLQIQIKRNLRFLADMTNIEWYKRML